MIDKANLEHFFKDFEEYIKAIVRDVGSSHPEDTLRVRDLREDLIRCLTDGVYKND